jgi:HSP20 family molecular chaperone IbpA
MTTLLTNKDVERALRQLPALFNEHWLDSVFDNVDRAFDVPNAVYPYNVLAVKDKDKEITHYEVHVALAGVSKNSIHVKVRDGKLHIEVSSATAESNPEQPSLYLKRGISQRAGNLTFNLDKKVNCKNITSSYIDGLLKVIIPVTKPEAINVDIAVN